MSDIITVKDMCLWYGEHQALKDVNIAIPEKSITAFIGPSGCGKSTFLKTLNRMNDLIPGVKITGDIRYVERTFSPKRWMLINCARKWAWCSRSPIPFP